MQIKKLKKIEILGTPFKIIWDQDNNDAVLVIMNNQ